MSVNITSRGRQWARAYLRGIWWLYCLQMWVKHVSIRVCVCVCMCCCRGRQRSWSWRTFVLRITPSTPASRQSVTCAASETRAPSSIWTTGQVTHINTHKQKHKSLSHFFRDVAVKNQFPFSFLWLLGFFKNINKKFVFFWSPDQIQHDIYRIRLFENFCSVSEKSSKASS